MGNPKNCVHVVEHVTQIGTQHLLPSVTSMPWDEIELLTARGHQHVAGLGLELYRNSTGELICKGHNRYGSSAAAGDEKGFLVSIPPCVWGPPPLPPPPRFKNGEFVRIVSRYDSSEQHLGVMGLYFIQVAIRSPFQELPSRVSRPLIQV